MNASTLRVPASLPNDSSDVAVALEVAGALWDKGDREEAIRWIGRAIEAAEEAGDAPRAAVLAEISGQLRATLIPQNGEPPPAEPAMTIAEPAPTSPPAGQTTVGQTTVGQATVGQAPVGQATVGQATADGPRVRVSVKTSIRDPSLLLLRRLSDGQAPPPGTREGFLVLAEAAVDARPLSNGSRST